MKHAKQKFVFNKYDNQKDEILEENNTLQQDVEENNKIDKIFKIICNVLIIFILVYFFKSCVITHGQSVSSIQKMIFFFFVVISICLFVGINYILSKKDYKLEKLFLIVMIPISIIYSLIMIPGMVPDEERT